MANIAIYTGDVSINGGGIAKFTINLYNALVEYHKCIIISDFCTSEKFHRGYENLDVYTIDKKNEFEKIKKLNRICKDLNIDLIISNETFLNRRCAIIKLLNKKSLRYITVTHMRSSLWYIEGGNIIINKLKKSLLKIGFNKASINVCVSKGLEKELKEDKFCKNTICVYNPTIDDNIVKLRGENRCLNISNKTIYNICVCGWISEIKNYESIIKAISLLKGKINVNLNIIGGYTESNKYYYENLRKLIDTLKLSENVIFHGILENPYSVMSKMDLLVLTSKVEALPTVLIEAMGLGLPVISSDCKYGPSEILNNGEYGILFKVDDEVELAESIIKILTDPLIYKNYKLKSIERSERFTLKEIGFKYSKIIQEIIKK